MKVFGESLYRRNMTNFPNLLLHVAKKKSYDKEHYHLILYYNLHDRNGRMFSQRTMFCIFLVFLGT